MPAIGKRCAHLGWAVAVLALCGCAHSPEDVSAQLNETSPGTGTAKVHLTATIDSPATIAQAVLPRGSKLNGSPKPRMSTPPDFRMITVDPCGSATGCDTSFSNPYPSGFSNMMFPASGPIGTVIGNVYVAMSDGSAFNGTVASSDPNFAVTGCPSACKLTTAITGITPNTRHPLTLTASQTGVTTSAAYPFTPVATGTTANTIEGLWMQGDGNITMPGNTFTPDWTIFAFVPQVANGIWNPGLVNGTITVGGADAALFNAATCCQGITDQLVSWLLVILPSRPLTAGRTYHITLTPTKAGYVNSGTISLPVTITATAAQTADAPLSNSTFPNFVKFFAARQGATSVCGAVAAIASNPAATNGINPWFTAYFVREEDLQSDGDMFTWGDGVNANKGLIPQGTERGGRGFFVVQNNNYVEGGNLTEGHRGTSSTNDFGQWDMIAMVYYGPNNMKGWMNGIWGSDHGAPKNWPTTNPIIVVGALNGGTYPLPTPGTDIQARADHHFLGSYSNMAVVLGVPTSAELETYRNGGGGYALAASIWGAGRIWAFWNFDGARGQPMVSPFTEPDKSGNGRDLHYYYAGDVPGGTAGNPGAIAYNSTTAPGGIAPTVQTVDPPACR